MSENQQPNNNVVLGGAAASGNAPVRKDDPAHNCLPIGTRLGEFEIVGLVGEGGFGIVYLAQDHSLQRKVALKEYMPASLASRGADASVIVRSERHQETFNIGRRSFVNEARLLAQFDHPALVKVYRFWEANGTAYMVMPFYEGKTLREVLYENDAPPTETWIKKILAPVIDALELIHRDSCFHRDIAPDNIILLPGDRPILLDFGAARRVIGDMTQALTVILKPGYAPIEQYAEMPGMKQGAWTDIYALAAVIYFMIARKLPPPSVSRIMQDTYEPLATLASGHYSEALLRGVDLCLTVRPEQRPQNMLEMKQALGMHATQMQAPPIQVQTAPKAATKPSPKPAPLKSAADSAPKNRTSKLPLFAVASTIVVLGSIGGYYYITKGTSSPSPQKTAANAPVIQAKTTPTEKPLPPVETPKPVFHSLDEALSTLNAQADPKMAPSLQLAPTVSVDGGTLKLTVRTSVTGYLYLFLWDKSEDKFYRLFPNELDKTNSLNAGTSFTVPRAKLPTPWSFAATEPKGTWQVFALLSEQPRDLTQTKFTSDASFASAGQAVINAALSGGAGLEALIGSIPCDAPGNCTDHFGWASATTEEIAAVARPPEKNIEPAKPVVRVPPPVVKPLPEIPSRNKPSGNGKPSDDSERAEREYMKQLNKDLDKLLGK